MEKTEKYEIILGGLPWNYSNKNDVANKWLEITYESFRNTSVLISAEIRECHVVYNSDLPGMSGEKTCIEIVCVRNPVLSPDKEQYVRVLSDIFNKLKVELSNTFAAIQLSQVDFSYFPPNK